MGKIRIGLIGLGEMGYVVATNLAKANLLDVVYNRTPTKASAFSEKYQVACASNIVELAKRSDLVLTVLPDDSAVLDVCAKLKNSMPQNSVLVDLSTITPSTSIRLQRELGDKKIGMLDSPIIGTPTMVGSKNAALAIGGQKTTFESVKSILEQITGKIVYFGEAGSGLYIKLVNNILVSSYIISLEEAMNFGLKAGLDPDSIGNFISNFATCRSPLSSGRGPLILKNDVSRNKSLKNIRKDLEIIESEARKMNIHLPITSFSLKYYNFAREVGFEKSFSEVPRIFENDASKI